MNEPRVLDQFTRDMLALFIIWAPYGGPPDRETMPGFGLSAAQVLERVREVVGSRRATELCNRDRDLVYHVRLASELMLKRASRHGPDDAARSTISRETHATRSGRTGQDGTQHAAAAS